MGIRLYPVGGAPWRRLPVPGPWARWASVTCCIAIFPNARGSGVPQTKAALYAREAASRCAPYWASFSARPATLASGIPLGREGPSVQVGAGIASVLGTFPRIAHRASQEANPSGGGCGDCQPRLNTPLAAVLFALEEIVGDLNAPVMGAVVLASATAWVFSACRSAIILSSKFRNINWVHPAEVCGLCGCSA